MSRQILFTLTLSLFLLLAACTSVQPTPTPTAVTAALRVTAVPPTRTVPPAPTATTSTETPTGTAVTTHTAVPATPTNTPEPTPIIPTQAIWTGIETPMPPAQAVISSENITMLQEIGRWGKGVVTDAVYSPDGRKLAAATPLGVYFYDAETARQLHFVQARQELVAFAISTDWQLIALGYAWPGGVDLLMLSNNSLLQTFETEHQAVTGLVFSPDSEILISRIQYKGVVGWHVSDGTQLDTLPPNYNQLVSVEDGDITVTVADGVLQLWQLTDGVLQEIPSNIVPAGEIGVTELSPDGELLAIGEDWGLRVWIWRLRDQTLLYTLDTSPLDSAMTGRRAFSKPAYRSGPGQHYINDLAFSPDGKTLAVTNGFIELTMWGMSTGELQKRIEDAGLEVTYAPDGSRLATWLHTLSQWQTIDGSLINTLNHHIGQVRDIVFTPDNRHLAIASSDHFIYLRDLSDGTLDHRLDGHTGGVMSIDISQDGKTLVSGSADKTIRIWNLQALTSFGWKASNAWEIQEVAISADGQVVASAPYDDSQRLWQVADGTLIGEGYGLMPTCPITFSPIEFLFATCWHADQIALWTLEPSRFLVGPEDFYADELAFSADGQYLAGVSYYPAVLSMWEIASGKVLYAVLVGEESGFPNLTFSPDGQLLAVIMGHTVQLRDAASGTHLITISSEYGFPSSVAFSPDGRILAIGSTDGTVRLWGVP